jgi:hypothetical protein
MGATPHPMPGLEQLQPWARRGFEEANRRRPREQTSRDDVAYGSSRRCAGRGSHRPFKTARWRPLFPRRALRFGNR